MNAQTPEKINSLIYLHGFASSPRSSKAQRFRLAAARLDLGFSCPDFNEPAFETLTVTRMLEQTADAIAGARPGPVALVGSSLGGFVAVLTAAGYAGAAAARRVDRLILLAPALDFGGNRLRQLGEHGIAEWRRRGSLRVFHYGDGINRDVRFALYEDAARYDAMGLEFAVPILVFQGRHDESVDPAIARRWSSSRPTVTLHMLEDGHQLAESVDGIVHTSEEFLRQQAVPRIPAQYAEQFQAGQELREMFDRMPLPASAVFVDLGCGAGPALAEAIRFSPQLMVGVDIDAEGLRVARSVLADSGVRHGLVRADLARLPFADGVFSHVSVRLSLPYVDQRAACSEIGRIMRPRGMAFLQLHSLRFYWQELWRERRAWKKVVLNGFCLVNGLVFRLTNRQLRLNLRTGVFQELAQTEGATTRCLRAAGLKVIWSENRRLFRMTAEKADD